MSQWDYTYNPQSGFAGPAEAIRIEDQPDHCQRSIKNRVRKGSVVCEECGNVFHPRIDGTWTKNQ